MHQLLRGWEIALEFGTSALLVGAILFSALEQNFSFRRFKKPWSETLLDLKYFFTNLIHPPVISFGLSAFFAFFMIRRDRPAPAISPLGFVAELLAVLFACDVLVYIRHRLFHGRDLWAFHSIHHSSQEVNWTSATRFHIAENILEAAGQILVFRIGSLMGGDPKVFVVAGIVTGVWNFFIHSNTRWTFGPLRFLLVCPVQHRWHHSDHLEAMDKNFAAMFSCIDVALGTFYMPKDVLPKSTGLVGDERKNHPRTFFGQLLYPFRSRDHAVNGRRNS